MMIKFFERLRGAILIAIIAIFALGGCSKDAPTSGEAPAAPSNLMGEAVGTYSVLLTWTDNSANEDGFVLYRSIGGPYNIAAEISSDVTVYTDVIETSCVEASYYLVAKNGDVESSNSNFITVPLLCGPESFLEDPNPNTL